MAADRRRPRPARPTRLTDRLLAGDGLGGRLGRLAEALRHRAAPNSWSFLFGVVSVGCLAVLVVTGVFLMFFYEPSNATTRYSGSYPLLRGVEMSRALETTLHISFDVRGGLLVRQAHHWAALILPASLLLQILSTFFTGAFRRPRQWSWVLLFGVFLLALVGGWSGYALPDDLLSGTGLRIVEGVVLGIPVVGTWLSMLIFGGEFPGRVLTHLYPVHVLVVPAALALLVVLRVLIAAHRKPPQLHGPGRSEETVVGVPVLPTAATKAAGLFFATIGVLVLMAATLTVSPVWLYGPASSGNANAGSQPDWYTAFLDGALRLVPPGWEVVWLGRTWTLAVLVPLAGIGLFLALAVAYPFLEERFTKDRREHHLLDRARDTPTRTGIGVAAVVFYGTLWGAGSADLIATQFRLSFEVVIAILQAVLLLGPVLAFLVTRQVCRALQLRDHELVSHGVESGRILRLASGGYLDVHASLPPAERWRRSSVDTRPPAALGAGAPAEDERSAPPDAS